MTPADYAAAFVAGARWWAEYQNLEFNRADDAAVAAGQSLDYDRRPGSRRGSWPVDCPARAFVGGAGWQEFEATGGTMWASDRAIAAREAERRYPIEARP